MAEQKQPVLAFKSCLQTTPRVSEPILSVNNPVGNLGSMQVSAGIRRNCHHTHTRNELPHVPEVAHVPAMSCHASDPCVSPSPDTEPDIATTIPTNPCKRTPPKPY